jgi:DNA-binding response OmpR family regulator
VKTLRHLDNKQTQTARDKGKSLIFDAIKRAHCNIQVVEGPIENELNTLLIDDMPIEVRLLIVVKFADLRNSILDLLRRSPAIPFIVYLEEYDEVTELLALRGGAADVLHSSIPLRVMTERIMLAHERGNLRNQLRIAPSEKDAHQIPLVHINYGNHTAELLGKKIHLTRMEVSILKVLNDNYGLVVKRVTLLKAMSLDISVTDERTVDSHIKRIRHKLVSTGLGKDVVKTVYGVGYRLDLKA